MCAEYSLPLPRKSLSCNGTCISGGLAIVIPGSSGGGFSAGLVSNEREVWLTGIYSLTRGHVVCEAGSVSIAFL